MKDLYTTLQWKEYEIKDIVKLVKGFFEIDVKKIPSKELRIALYDTLGLPKDAEEFLRYYIYKITENTLLIKDKDLFESIEENIEENSNISILKKYIKENGYIPLAEIFNRYKPLFLAMKNEHSKSIINRISKLSKKHHKPKGMPGYLQITENIEKGLSLDEFKNIIKTLDTSYLIKLGNSLKYRMNCKEVGIYYIRNGKTFVKETNLKGNYEPYYNVVLELIQNKINKNLKELNIRFDLENYKNYALPTSGKQFTGQIPNGTYIEDFNLLGVYWNNIDNTSVDLDLSITNENYKIGWNSDWNKEEDIVYSGDMTDAKDGAVESILINSKELYLLKLNWFNYRHFDNKNCPFTFFAGYIKYKNKLPTKTIPENINYKVNMEISTDNPQIILGVILDKFYFGEIKLPDMSVADLDNKISLKAIKSLLESKIRFEDLELQFKENSKETELNKNVLLEIVK